jgi:hypothetical protein
MFSPCKNCLVRAACSKDCNKFNRYVENSTYWISFFSIIISGILLFIIFYFSGLMEDNTVTNKHQIIVSIIWGVSTVCSFFINVESGEKISEIVIVLFAPYVFLIFINIYILSFIFKIGIRKRA